MTEVVEAPNAEQEDADFEKGFNEARAHEAPAEKKPEQPAEKPEAEVASEPKAQAKPEEKTEAKPEEKPAEQKPTLIGGMSEQDWNAAVAKAAGIDALRQEIRKNFGQYGEVKRSLDDLAQKFAAGSQSGAARKKITAEMLKRVNEELPGLGDALAQDLSEVLGAAEAAEKKAEDQGKAFNPDAFFAEKLAPALKELEARANERAELRIVKSIHRDFDTVVKSEEFRGWLDALPADRQKEIRESEDGFVAADAVTEFKDHSAKQKKAKEQKKTRLESAVTPQGAPSAAGPTPKDEDADFDQGFKEAGKKYAR